MKFEDYYFDSNNLFESIFLFKGREREERGWIKFEDYYFDSNNLFELFSFLKGERERRKRLNEV